MPKIVRLGLVLANLTLASMTAFSAAAQRLLPDIIISSAVPPNGDLNPYGVAFVPSNFPPSRVIAPGDILVSNFNDAATTQNPGGIQGTGTTIVKLTPNGVIAPAMQASTFFTSTQIGLTTALGVLEGGFVIVGNLPNSNGTLAPGSLQLIDRNGKLVQTITDPLIDGPWDLTIDDDPDQPTIFVSNVLNGTVVRLSLALSSKKFSLTKIASGYTFRTDPTALVLGPTGLAHDRATDTLYVASTADNAIYAVPQASVRKADAGTGAMIAKDGQLRGPLALALAPNGDLITSNGDAVNADPTQPSEIVELAKSGTFVGQFNVDPGQGGAFGIGIASAGPDTVRLAVVDDNANDIIVFDQAVEPGN